MVYIQMTTQELAYEVISRLKKEQQLRQKKQIEESVSIPVDTIAPQYYGMMNGKGVFKEIEKKYNL